MRSSERAGLDDRQHPGANDPHEFQVSLSEQFLQAFQAAAAAVKKAHDQGVIDEQTFQGEISRILNLEVEAHREYEKAVDKINEKAAESERHAATEAAISTEKIIATKEKLKDEYAKLDMAQEKDVQATIERLHKQETAEDQHLIKLGAINDAYIRQNELAKQLAEDGLSTLLGAFEGLFPVLGQVATKLADIAGKLLDIDTGGPESSPPIGTPGGGAPII